MSIAGYVLIIGGVVALVGGVAVLWITQPVPHSMHERYSDL